MSSRSYFDTPRKMFIQEDQYLWHYITFDVGDQGSDKYTIYSDLGNTAFTYLDDFKGRCLAIKC